MAAASAARLSLLRSHQQAPSRALEISPQELGPGYQQHQVRFSKKRLLPWMLRPFESPLVRSATSAVCTCSRFLHTSEAVAPSPPPPCRLYKQLSPRPRPDGSPAPAATAVLFYSHSCPHCAALLPVYRCLPAFFARKKVRCRGSHRPLTAPLLLPAWFASRTPAAKQLTACRLFTHHPSQSLAASLSLLPPTSPVSAAVSHPAAGAAFCNTSCVHFQPKQRRSPSCPSTTATAAS